jgi:hypothetical protein
MTMIIRHVPDCYAVAGIAVFSKDSSLAEDPENHSDSITLKY